MSTQHLSIDIAANRAARKYRSSEQLRRLGWSLAALAFRLSPRPMFAWRRLLLRMFGATVGRQVHVYRTARICMPWMLQIGDWSAIGDDAYIYNLGPVRIGERVTISYRTHICAGSHDFSDAALHLTRPPVTIGDDVWIGTDAFIGPGVNIGNAAMVGARAVVVKDVPALHIVAGNPARRIGLRPVDPRDT